MWSRHNIAIQTLTTDNIGTVNNFCSNGTETDEFQWTTTMHILVWSMFWIIRFSFPQQLEDIKMTHILWIRTVSFCAISVHLENSFRIFSVYIKFILRTVFYEYTNTVQICSKIFVIPCILRKRIVSFCVLSVYYSLCTIFSEYIYICTYMCMYMYVYVCVHVHVHMQIHIYIRLHIYRFIYSPALVPFKEEILNRVKKKKKKRKMGKNKENTFRV